MAPLQDTAKQHLNAQSGADWRAAQDALRARVIDLQRQLDEEKASEIEYNQASARALSARKQAVPSRAPARSKSRNPARVRATAAAEEIEYLRTRLEHIDLEVDGNAATRRQYELAREAQAAVESEGGDAAVPSPLLQALVAKQEREEVKKPTQQTIGQQLVCARHRPGSLHAHARRSFVWHPEWLAS
jgi:hypothetical protein